MPTSTTILELANHRVNVARHLWRLALEMKAIAPRTYEHGAGRIVGLGAQIGGWRKAAPP
jgi:hypothetical protein